jgi:hypothetical protein
MKLHQAAFAALLTLLLNAFAPRASAITNEQANQQIDAAINTHYASADIDLAEKKLLGIIKACGSTCSPTVVAHAWMYVGIVRGSGRDDVGGAQEAFKTAKTIDPSVKLDEMFATDLVKKVFADSPGPGGATGEPALIGDMKSRAATAPDVTSIQCSLTAAEVETQRPIPIACRTAPGADKVVVSYRHENSNRWHQLPLVKQPDGSFSGEIPCTDTGDIGVLSYRVQAINAQGQEVDALGTEGDPRELSLVQQTDVAPPSLPGQPPPASCRPKKAPEPKGPKLGSYGDACSDGAECQGGLTCTEGKCAADISCDSDAECFSGQCVDNVCVTPNEDCEGEDCKKTSRVPRNWVGIQGGLDFAMMSGDQVCGRGADVAYSCFEAGDPYRGLPNQNFAGSIDSGFRTATARVMLSYERVISSILSVEGRFGFAFNGGPESSAERGGDSSKFLPYHAEGRLKLYFSRVYREDGSGLRGPSGFAMLGGGLAQVDPHVSVPVAECRANAADSPFTPGQPIMISQGEQNCIQSANRALEIKDVEVYQRLGQGFVTAGLGLRWGFGKHIAAIAAINGQLLLPSTGLTLSPSLGVLAGF